MYDYMKRHLAERLALRFGIREEDAYAEIADFTRDMIAIPWTVEDIRTVAEGEGPDDEGMELGFRLTDEECREVLKRLENDHDATCGITWDTVYDAIQVFVSNREEKEMA
jgi:hypothetical protein